MLIAMMGETFSVFNEVKKQIKVRDHLSFVMDNWYLNRLSLGGKIGRMRFIVSAFFVTGGECEEELQKELEEKIDQVFEACSTEQNLVI